MGAIGDPSVPDHESLWGSILAIRQHLDLWANERPARLLPGIPSPLAGRGPADVDMLFVRENTEGEYAGVGGRSHRGQPLEVGIETSIFTRVGVERVVRHAFGLAAGRRGVLTSATKSNASRFGYVLWDEVVEEVGAEFPGVRVERVLVDALAARMVLDPGSLDVVVASNLFADILTDVAAAVQGGMGMAASANLAPGSDTPGLFEPVHGSAPDIAGRGIANPSGAIWSASLMLEHLGEPEAARSGDARAGVGLPGRPAHARCRRERVHPRGRRRRRGSSIAQRRTLIIAPPTSTSAPESTVRRPMCSLLPIRIAARNTAQTDCVALSGATTLTRPWSKASTRLA